MRPQCMLALLAFLPVPLYAGIQGVGTSSAAFLKLGSGARPQALGEAFTALADDASGIAYNPAGMSQMLGSEVQATHSEWFQEMRYENLSSVLSLGNGGMLGLTFDFLSIPSITRTEQVANNPDPALNYQETGNFSPYDLCFALAYSKPVYPGLLAGINVKVISQSIDDRSSLGLGLDLGSILVTPLQGLTAGLAVQNLGTSIKFKRESFDLPWLVRVGAAYHALDDKLSVLVESDIPSDDAVLFAFGLEYLMGDRFYPRLGYRLNNQFNPWSAGMGMKFGDAQVDLSLVPYGELGLTYRASLGYHFGQPTAQLSSRLPYLSSAAGAKPVLIETGITATEKVEAWGLYIYDASHSGKVLKSVSGKGAIEGPLSWDGKFSDGRTAPEGDYFAVLSVRYINGKVIHTPYLKLQVQNLAPELDLSIDPVSLISLPPGEALIPTLFRTSVKSGRVAKSWRLEILDQNSKVFRTYAGQGAVPSSVVWDGKSESGEALISGQIYQARIWAVDLLGNEAPSPKPLIFKAVFR